MQVPRCHVIAAALLLAGVPVAGKTAGCSRQSSERASVSQIASAPDRYRSRCVAIDGVMQGVFLFGSVDGVYLQPSDVLDPSSSGSRLGLDNLKRLRSERYQHVSIVGRVQDCETMRGFVHSTAGEDEIVMVSGYCHGANGAYLWVNDLQFRRGPPFMRQMGHRAHQVYGNLVPPPADWPHRSKVEARVGEFLNALRAADREALASMHFWNFRAEEEADLVYFLLDARNSPFAQVRQSVTPPQQLILVYRSQEEDDYSATVCFCRSRECSGRWPIASFDADNVPARPYACTEFGSFVEMGREVDRFKTPMEKYGLAEPD